MQVSCVLKFLAILLFSAVNINGHTGSKNTMHKVYDSYFGSVERSHLKKVPHDFPCNGHKSVDIRGVAKSGTTVLEVMVVAILWRICAGVDSSVCSTTSTAPAYDRNGGMGVSFAFNDGSQRQCTFSFRMGRKHKPPNEKFIHGIWPADQRQPDFIERFVTGSKNRRALISARSGTHPLDYAGFGINGVGISSAGIRVSGGNHSSSSPSPASFSTTTSSSPNVIVQGRDDVKPSSVSLPPYQADTYRGQRAATTAADSYRPLLIGKQLPPPTQNTTRQLEGGGGGGMGDIDGWTQGQRQRQRQRQKQRQGQRQKQGRRKRRRKRMLVVQGKKLVVKHSTVRPTGQRQGSGGSGGHGGGGGGRGACLYNHANVLREASRIRHLLFDHQYGNGRSQNEAESGPSSLSPSSSSYSFLSALLASLANQTPATACAPYSDRKHDHKDSSKNKGGGGGGGGGVGGDGLYSVESIRGGIFPCLAAATGPIYSACSGSGLPDAKDSRVPVPTVYVGIARDPAEVTVSMYYYGKMSPSRKFIPSAGHLYDNRLIEYTQPRYVDSLLQLMSMYSGYTTGWRGQRSAYVIYNDLKGEEDKRKVIYAIVESLLGLKSNYHEQGYPEYKSAATATPLHNASTGTSTGTSTGATSTDSHQDPNPSSSSSSSSIVSRIVAAISDDVIHVTSPAYMAELEHLNDLPGANRDGDGAKVRASIVDDTTSSNTNSDQSHSDHDYHDFHDHGSSRRMARAYTNTDAETKAKAKTPTINNTKTRTRTRTSTVKVDRKRLRGVAMDRPLLVKGPIRGGGNSNGRARGGRGSGVRGTGGGGGSGGGGSKAMPKPKPQQQNSKQQQSKISSFQEFYTHNSPGTVQYALFADHIFMPQYLWERFVYDRRQDIQEAVLHNKEKEEM